MKLTLILGLSLLGISTAADMPVPPVPEADLSQLLPADFEDDELVIPFYLAHFHRVANSVSLSGPNRGFITLPVWRPEKYNKPFNARVLENYVTLAYFYSADRPWNPYYGHAAVRARLEAVLDFWCRSQHEDGRFSEYKPEGWNLPATGFAVMFMGETLRMLHEGPPIDPALHARVIAAHKKAITVMLEQDELFHAGRNYSNQYSGLWGGALAHLALYPDAAILQRLEERLRQSLREHQSPAGYWYEGGGCDWPYTLRTHEGNLLMAWHYAQDTPLAALLVKGKKRWTEWRSYNAVPEPGGNAYVLNRAVDTRTPRPYSIRPEPMADAVPAARAFLPTRDEYRAALLEKRRQVEKTWPNVPDLEIGEDHAYSPHPILNLTHHAWYPDAGEREAARRQLPVFSRNNFNQQRYDDRNPQGYTFLRRPGYYAIFNSGRSLTKLQRFGLGLVWTDAHGTVLQSQANTRREAWGTRADESDNVYETALPGALFKVSGSPVVSSPGAQDLPEGDMEISYPLRDRGNKRLSFLPNTITVRVEHEDPFSEQVPLLVPPNGRVVCEATVATLTSADGTSILTVAFDISTSIETHETETSVAGKRLIVVSCPGAGVLTYQLTF